MSPRCLKIESDGDAWKKSIKPKIRLMGRWLEEMGFPPERHVEVSPVEPGVLQIRLKPLPGQIGESGGYPVPQHLTFEDCAARIEHLRKECLNAFSPAWRHHCKREISELEAFVAKHYPQQAVRKTTDLMGSDSLESVNRPF